MPDKIIAKFSVEIPKPQASSLFPWLPAAVAGFRPLPPAAPPAAAAWLLLGGLALVAALRYWPPKFALPASFARAGLLLVMAVSAGVWLTGCFGLQFWGTFSGTYTYTRLEAADAANLPAGAAELPGITWVLTEGTGEILYDLHFQVTTEDTEGNEITEEQTCKITFETNLTGFVGASDMVPLPEE
jgi:hypothetical protein